MRVNKSIPSQLVLFQTSLMNPIAHLRKTSKTHQQKRENAQYFPQSQNNSNPQYSKTCPQFKDIDPKPLINSTVHKDSLKHFSQ